mgnify:CR=1 FL=1
MTPLSAPKIISGKVFSVLWTLALVLMATLPGYLMLVMIQPVMWLQVNLVLICLVWTAILALAVSATVGSLFRIPLPVGGGYFRIFPLAITRKSISGAGAAGQPAMFYTHPWEYDPAQPRVDGIQLKSRFRHYTGLKRSGTRLKRLLRLHRFAPMTSIIDAYRQSNRLKSIELTSP